MPEQRTGQTVEQRFKMALATLKKIDKKMAAELEKIKTFLSTQLQQATESNKKTALRTQLATLVKNVENYVTLRTDFKQIENAIVMTGQSDLLNDFRSNLHRNCITESDFGNPKEIEEKLAELTDSQAIITAPVIQENYQFLKNNKSDADGYLRAKKLFEQMQSDVEKVRPIFNANSEDKTLREQFNNLQRNMQKLQNALTEFEKQLSSETFHEVKEAQSQCFHMERTYLDEYYLQPVRTWADSVQDLKETLSQYGQSWSKYWAPSQLKFHDEMIELIRSFKEEDPVELFMQKILGLFVQCHPEIPKDIAKKFVTLHESINDSELYVLFNSLSKDLNDTGFPFLASYFSQTKVNETEETEETAAERDFFSAIEMEKSTHASSTQYRQIYQDVSQQLAQISDIALTSVGKNPLTFMKVKERAHPASQKNGDKRLLEYHDLQNLKLNLTSIKFDQDFFAKRFQKAEEARKALIKHENDFEALERTVQELLSEKVLEPYFFEQALKKGEDESVYQDVDREISSKKKEIQNSLARLRQSFKLSHSERISQYQSLMQELFEIQAVYHLRSADKSAKSCLESYKTEQNKNIGLLIKEMRAEKDSILVKYPDYSLCSGILSQTAFNQNSLLPLDLLLEEKKKIMSNIESLKKTLKKDGSSINEAAQKEIQRTIQLLEKKKHRQTQLIAKALVQLYGYAIQDSEGKHNLSDPRHPLAKNSSIRPLRASLSETLQGHKSDQNDDEFHTMLREAVFEESVLYTSRNSNTVTHSSKIWHQMMSGQRVTVDKIIKELILLSAELDLQKKRLERMQNKLTAHQKELSSQNSRKTDKLISKNQNHQEQRSVDSGNGNLFPSLRLPLLRKPMVQKRDKTEFYKNRITEAENAVARIQKILTKHQELYSHNSTYAKQMAIMNQALHQKKIQPHLTREYLDNDQRNVHRSRQEIENRIQLIESRIDQQDSSIEITPQLRQVFNKEDFTDRRVFEDEIDRQIRLAMGYRGQRENRNGHLTHNPEKQPSLIDFGMLEEFDRDFALFLRTQQDRDWNISLGSQTSEAFETAFQREIAEWLQKRQQLIQKVFHVYEVHNKNLVTQEMNRRVVFQQDVIVQGGIIRIDTQTKDTSVRLIKSKEMTRKEYIRYLRFSAGFVIHLFLEFIRNQISGRLVIDDSHVTEAQKMSQAIGHAFENAHQSWRTKQSIIKSNANEADLIGLQHQVICFHKIKPSESAPDSEEKITMKKT